MENEEKKVSLQELLQFLKNSYEENVWNGGIGDLYKMFPSKRLVYLGNPYFKNCYDIIVSNSDFKKKCLYIVMEYRYNEEDNIAGLSTITYCKKDNKIFIDDSSFGADDIKKILLNIDFTKVYDYCVENSFYKSLNATYNFGNNNIDTQINLKNNSISLGAFGFVYRMKLNNLVRKEVEHYNSKALEIYAYDDDFLNHLMVSFKDLPKYIQDNWETYAYKDNKESKVKKFFKRFKSSIN